MSNGSDMSAILLMPYTAGVYFVRVSVSVISGLHSVTRRRMFISGEWKLDSHLYSASSIFLADKHCYLPRKFLCVLFDRIFFASRPNLLSIMKETNQY